MIRVICGFQALDLRPEDKSCLVSRSQCYLQLGDSEAALIDAEAVLKDDIDNTKVSLIFPKMLSYYK